MAEKTVTPTPSRLQAPGWSLFPMPLNVIQGQTPPPEMPLPALPSYMGSDGESNWAAAEVRDIPRNRAHPSILSSTKQSVEKHQNSHFSRNPPQTQNPQIHTLHAQSSQTQLHVPARVRSVGDLLSSEIFYSQPPSSRYAIEHFEHYDHPLETESTFEPDQEPQTEEIIISQIKEMPPKMPVSEQALSPESRPRSRQSLNGSTMSSQTNATSLPSLAPLQSKVLDEHDALEPLNEEDIDPGSFDLIAPADERGVKQYSLESRSEQVFSTEHLRIIFSDPSFLLSFTSFLSSQRPSSVPVLIYYLDAIKALKAISYANAIAEALDPIAGYDFTANLAKKTANEQLDEKARQAFDVMVREDLPAFVAFTYTQTVSLSIQRRITGTLPAHLREASEGLAEVFCLTDPSRPDNPIVFASEEFHRTTQYGMSYVLGRNCRFLQGPKTSPHSVRRLRDAIDAGREHCEVFLNYRRDGSPFMNLLMMAPLCDSRGTIRYFIGAQVDVSGLVKDCADLESLKRLVDAVDAHNSEQMPPQEADDAVPPKDEFQELSEMLNLQELDTVRKWGGRMHKESHQEIQDTNFKSGNWAKPRLLINNSPDGKNFGSTTRPSGKLNGIYENYLLVRPYPSLRILFASPSLRVPGILQSPFMAKIGGSHRVREELTKALADGRGVTAKVRWVSKSDPDGRNRWIHCTPLIGSNGAIGVWMVVIVNDETSDDGKKFKMAPPVDPKFGRNVAPSRDTGSLRDFAIMSGGNSSREGSLKGVESLRSHRDSEPERSASPYSLRI